MLFCDCSPILDYHLTAVPHNDKIGYLAETNHVSLRGVIAAVAISIINILFSWQGQEDTLRRHYFDRSEKCG